MITLLPVILDLFTILSALYRLWASVRHNQLREFWLPAWKPDCAYGLKQSLAADALAFHTCMDISIHAQDNFFDQRNII